MDSRQAGRLTAPTLCSSDGKQCREALLMIRSRIDLAGGRQFIDDLRQMFRSLTLAVGETPTCNTLGLTRDQ
jgi:hypothetical protein